MNGVNVVGYFGAENGVGEVARRLVSLLRHARVPHSILVNSETPCRQWDPWPVAGDASAKFDTNVLCINADQTEVFARTAEPGLFGGRHTVGVWAWEVDVCPSWMRKAANFVDEVWVYSRHAAEAVRGIIDKPVSVLPPAIFAPMPTFASRQDLGLPDGFVFLFAFDFLSVVERKNPLGLIDVFCRAFRSDQGAILVLKTVNGRFNPEALQTIRARIADRRDIVLIEDYFERGRQAALMNSCDAYVSLHRAEGFGLTPGEAMALGKPVVATGYSGNLEFMTEENSLLIPYELVAVPPGCDPYPTTARWAEPNLDAAAEAMRMLFFQPRLAREIGTKGRADIAAHHSLDARSTLLAGLLEAVEARRGLRPSSRRRTSFGGMPIRAAIRSALEWVVRRSTAGNRVLRLFRRAAGTDRVRSEVADLARLVTTLEAEVKVLRLERSRSNGRGDQEEPEIDGKPTRAPSADSKGRSPR